MITVDILQISDPGTIEQWDSVSSNAYVNFKRKSDLKGVYHGGDTLSAVKRAHPDVNWRHHIIQTKKATGFDELTFDPDVTLPLIEGGK